MNSMFKGILYFFYFLLVLILGHVVYEHNSEDLTKLLRGVNLDNIVYAHPQQNQLDTQSTYSGGGGTQER